MCNLPLIEREREPENEVGALLIRCEPALRKCLVSVSQHYVKWTPKMVEPAQMLVKCVKVSCFFTIFGTILGFFNKKN